MYRKIESERSHRIVSYVFQRVNGTKESRVPLETHGQEGIPRWLCVPLLEI